MARKESKGCLSIRMMNELGDNAMYVERLLPATREKLVTIADGAPLTEAANFLHKGTDLVIVCDSAGLLAGVITKIGCCRPNEQTSGSELHNGSFIGDDTRRRGLSATRPASGPLEPNERAEVEEHSCGGQGFSTSGSYFMRGIFYKFFWRNLKMRSQCCEIMLWASAT